ncbi:MAG TPA: FAD-binding oxidoreductase [Terriglobales bacterium]|nr:FAD-binding oxidoreductase [Terriglobales bacterium]
MSAAETAVSLARELAAIVGEEHVREDAAALAGLAVEEVAPAVAVAPGSAEEVAAVLRFASGHELTVVPAGGFARQGIGGVPERVDVVLETRRLAALEHYDPGDLTLGAGAGMTLAALDEKLAANQQFIPVASPRPELETLGGLLATAASSPLRHGYGGLRDYCIGVHFVTGDGRIAKGGGRVVKNVAGYDLMKLLIGSFGTLGVIVSANFKVFPRPRQTATFACDFASAAEALAFRDRLLRSALSPICLELVSPRAEEYLREAPPPRNVDDLHPVAPVELEAGAWRVLVRAAGSDAVLARYRRDLSSAVSEELAGEADAAFWRQFLRFEDAVLKRHHNAMMVNVSLSLSAVAGALAAAERALDNNFLPAAVGRFGAGSLALAFLPLLVDPPSAMQYVAAVSAFRGALPRDASAVVVRCPREAKLYFDVWGSSPTDRESMRKVKRALDPAGVLNRGRFVV